MKRIVLYTTISIISAVLLLAAGVFGADWYMARSSEQNITQHAEIAKAETKPAPVEEQKPPTRVELLKLVNAERKKAGVAPLTEDKRLDWSAQQKADDMSKYVYYDHINPKTGLHGYSYIDQTGIKCYLDSENIALLGGSYYTSSGLVANWKSSKSHYEAMINPKYTTTGFGFAPYGDQSYMPRHVAVEHFCQNA